jgi:uncharacterized BrkB/YihY/UPF0761 family membrane protein
MKKLDIIYIISIITVGIGVFKEKATILVFKEGLEKTIKVILEKVPEKVGEVVKEDILKLEKNKRKGEIIFIIFIIGYSIYLIIEKIKGKIIKREVEKIIREGKEKLEKEGK